ncbi:hypothetical protein CK203_027087 [Vitis vinifera]|uniref:UDP-glcnac-adolichol phosphate glcnac-1-p-transferase n=1 Tax=Vitis vinifera TaxID=29760 RepID=A0A438DKR8_VITVI|nr:hypothetical protein CK203_078235 [Vitis vinifera]RVW92129.1 hypothetical protein CK203_027087 [Vitis vinifera]
MTVRKRASSETTAAAAAQQPKSQETTTATSATTTDPPIAPPKSGTILKLSLLLIIPYAYLILFHYRVDADLKRSILINAGLSLAGFFVTRTMIPVASSYVIRRSLFGYDINKKGTPQGSVKVPESLGIVVGIVFLVLAILFQYFNFTSDSNGPLVGPG